MWSQRFPYKKAKPTRITSAVLWHVHNQWPYNAVHIHRLWHYLIYIPKRTNRFACYIYSVNLNPLYIYICLLLLLKITSSTIVSYSICLSAQLQSNRSKWMGPLMALLSLNKDRYDTCVLVILPTAYWNILNNVNLFLH